MEKNGIIDIPFFMILGRPRSGTTLLQTLFDAHPNVKIPPEFPIILPLYQKFRNVKDWDERKILSFIDQLFQSPAFDNRKLDNLKLDRKAYTSELLALAHKGTIQDFLKSFNYYSCSLFPKGEIQCVGDKNPVYSIYAKRFLKIFPDARFICIIRDYRDNFISMKGLDDLNLEAQLLSLQVLRWRYVVRLFLACKKKYPSRFYIVRYEDLVQNHEKVFGELCSFLGIQYDPVVFNFFTKKEESLKRYPKELIEKYHGSLMNPIHTGRMELWKKELSENQVKSADHIAGKYADLLGYERKYIRFNLLLYLKFLPLVIYCWLIFKILEFGSYLPYRISLMLNVNLSVLVRTYNFILGKKIRLT